MTAPTEDDRRMAAAILRSDYSRRYLDEVAQLIADTRAEVIATVERLDPVEVALGGHEYVVAELHRRYA